MLRKVDPSSTFCNHFFFQLAIPKSVAWKVEHAVVIEQQRFSTFNAIMLRDKLNENVARVTWPQREPRLLKQIDVKLSKIVSKL